VISKAPAQYVRAYLYRKVEELQDAQQLLEQSPAPHQRLNHRQLALLNHALEHPRFVYKIDRHQSSHHVTYQTARTDLLDLVAMGLLEKSTVGRTFIFVPPEDLRARLDALRRGPDAPASSAASQEDRVDEGAEP
jgi:Fic family protein